ncbi:MAG: zinc metallopeptidase [Methylococcales bacterium]|nr:zinc metallopeptidase [Methylococcales bacterium]
MRDDNIAKRGPPSFISTIEAYGLEDYTQAMLIVFIILFIALIIFGPQWWAKRTFARYAIKQAHISGTGGELALHLLERFEIQDVGVEITEKGDHYSPDSKMVRLSENNYNDNSLTAVAVAAHEVGHAIQHHHKETKLALRTSLIKIAGPITKIGSTSMIIMPIVLILTRSPGAALFFILVGLASIVGSTLIHLLTLPVEWDASFGKALPILKEGYIHEEDIPAVERILTAAALTYVAASLVSILNIWRWIALLRR